MEPRPGRRGWRLGLTGIETAIILIAIVLVAAAFAFVVMNMGFGAVQKTGESITRGTAEASSALEVAGNVLVFYNGTNNKGFVLIYVKPGVGGAPVDINKTVVSYTVQFPSDYAIHFTGNVTFTKRCNPNPININITVPAFACVTSGNDNNLIEIGEKFAIILNVTKIYELTKKSAPNPVFQPYMEFTVEIKPPTGAVLIVGRRIPASLMPVMETW